MKDQTRVIAALLIGVAAGAALGILLAPEKGETLREGFTEYIEDLVDSSKNKLKATRDELKDYSKSILNDAKLRVKETVNNVNI
jgi:gas vesicle protein